MIYSIQDTSSAAIKIGCAKDPWKRLSELQVGTPGTLAIIGAMDGGPSKEAEIHRLFRRSRLRGEWFRSTDDLLAFAANLQMPPRPTNAYRQPWGESGLTTAQVAALSGVSVSQLGRYRTGRSEPTLSGAIKLSKITGLPVEAFAKRDAA